MNFVRSVKFRLTLWYAFILAILLSVFSFYMYVEFSRVLYRDVDKNLTLEAESFEDSMQSYLEGIFRGVEMAESRRHPHFIFYFSPEIQLKLQDVITQWERVTRSVSGSTHIIRFIGLDEAELLSNQKGWEKEIIFPPFERDNLFLEKEESFQTVYFEKKPVRLYYRLVRHRNRPIFIIQSGVPIFEVEKALHRLLFIILISIPGAVLAACLAGWFLARRSFRPVDSMSQKAREITAAYLKDRLPRTGSKDELDRLAETLNEMMDRIESSTRAVQDFSSDVSHELKTPLAIIRGEVDLALRRTRSTDELKKTLHVVGDEVNELIRLVDDLMLLVRSDARQLRIEMKRVSMEEVLSYVFSRYQDRGIEKGIEMNLEIAKDFEIQADPVYLKRLFSNLLDNAIKFTPENGKVSVRAFQEQSQVVVEVEDTGMGIDAEVREKVFSRFYRTDAARSKEGSGLGLNIVKAIADAHQGKIQIESTSPRGTLVRVFLPL